jgi:hypothetical protein
MNMSRWARSPADTAASNPAGSPLRRGPVLSSSHCRRLCVDFPFIAIAVCSCGSAIVTYRRLVAVAQRVYGTVVVVYGERPETWQARAALFARDADGVLVKRDEFELPSGYLESLIEWKG